MNEREKMSIDGIMQDDEYIYNLRVSSYAGMKLWVAEADNGRSYVVLDNEQYQDVGMGMYKRLPEDPL